MSNEHGTQGILADRTAKSNGNQIIFEIDARAKDTFAKPDIYHQIDLSVIGDDGFVENLSLTRSWMSPTIQRIVPGAIRLYQAGEHFTIYTYGGFLHYVETNSRSHYKLASSAPLLELSKYHHIPDILADESEILFAKIHSLSLLDKEEVQQLLAQIVPFKLYCACLQFFDRHLDVLNTAEEMLHMEAFREFVRSEISDFQARYLWPSSLPNLWAICLADPTPIIGESSIE